MKRLMLISVALAVALCNFHPIIPAKAGSQALYPAALLGSRFRGSDGVGIWSIGMETHPEPLSWLQARIDAITPASAPAFIASYDVQPGNGDFDTANAESAFTYDQALAISALLSVNDIARARRLGDALVWAEGHDRFYHDGRLRNAYRAGLAVDNPVKLPGRWSAEEGKWIEGSYEAGSATGNNAWAGLALLRLSTATGERRYAEAAHAIGKWLIGTVGAVGTDKGFRGGFEGFEPAPEVLGWKSTEHNADALAFLRLLDKTYPGEGFGRAASGAGRFVAGMWLADHFATGTLADGTTPNAGYSSLDAQTFPLLALNSFPSDSAAKAMAYLQRTHGLPGGLDYSDAREGVWTEGTAQAALVYARMGDPLAARQLLADCLHAVGPGGEVEAVIGPERLQTKLRLGNGEGPYWYYYRRPHIAPAAWMIMARAGYDPLE